MTRRAFTGRPPAPKPPAEAAAQPPSEARAGLKQYRRVLTFFVFGPPWDDRLGVMDFESF